MYCIFIGTIIFICATHVFNASNIFAIFLIQRVRVYPTNSIYYLAIIYDSIYNLAHFLYCKFSRNKIEFNSKFDVKLFVAGKLHRLQMFCSKRPKTGFRISLLL